MHDNETYLYGPLLHPAGVLVVEDYDTLREQLAWVFTEEGYIVEQANDGNEALDFLRTTDTRQVVLLDWQLPEMTGLELLAILSHDQVIATRHTYLLLTVWYEHLDNALASFTPTLRVTAMRKPFDLEVLLAWVAQAAGYLNFLTTTTDRNRP